MDWATGKKSVDKNGKLQTENDMPNESLFGDKSWWKNGKIFRIDHKPNKV
jgi:hypothetical protein